MSKIRDAMKKSRGEYREAAPLRERTPASREGRNSEDGAGSAALSSLTPEILSYYEAIGKQVEVALAHNQTRKIVFTGAIGGDGISTVLTQFAEMLAKRGERVLLIDGNPRHPSLHRRLGVPETPGLAEFVAGTARRDSLIHPTRIENLSLVPLGRCTDRSQAERISGVLGKFENAYMDSFDYVLVDSDFIGSPFFSQAAVGEGDGIVLVIRAGKTNRQIVARALETVRRINGRVLGVVLNRREFPIPNFIYRRL